MNFTLKEYGFIFREENLLSNGKNGSTQRKTETRLTMNLSSDQKNKGFKVERNAGSVKETTL